MINKKLGYGLGLSFALGLSGCYFDGTQSAQEVDYGSQNSVVIDQQGSASNNVQQPKQKTYATKEPTQKATPGPKRTAAPSLPVIQ